MIEAERVKSALIEWEVDPSKGVDGIKKLAKEVREEQRNERDLQTVRKALSVETTKLTQAMDGLSGVLNNRLSISAKGAGEALGQLAVRGLSAVATGFREALDWSERFAKQASVMKGSVEGAVQATGHAVSVLDLMTAKNKLATLGVKMTDDEFARFAGDAQKLAGAMGGDLASALDSASTALARQSVPMADNIGVVMNAEAAYEAFAAKIGKTSTELSANEKRLAFQAEFLDQMRAKAEALPPPIDTATGSLKKLYNATTDFLGKGLAEANEQIPKWAGSLGNLLVPKLADTKKGIAEINEEMKRLAKEMQELGAGELMAIGNAAMAKAIDEAGPLVEGTLTARGGGGPRGGGFDKKWEELTGRKKMVASTTKKPGAPKEEKLWGAPNWGGLKAEDLMNAGGGAGLAGFGLGGAGGFAAGAFGTMQGAQAEEDARFAAIQAEWLSDPSKRLAETLPTEGFDSLTDAQLRSLDATMKLREEMKNAGEVMSATFANIKDMGVGALGDLAGGMWNAADAAIQGGESFGVAMGKMLKSTLLSIATQSTVKAVFETAEGIAALARWDIPGATAHFTSAGIYAGVAVMAGGAGLAMSAAGVGASGGGAARASSGASNGSGRYQETPQYGQKVENKKPININLYLGDPDSPSLSLLMTKQLKAQLGEATN